MNILQAEDNFLPVVSVSIGVAWEYARKDVDFAWMQKRADEALYQAKESGRACVYLEGKCYAKTQRLGNRKQYYVERGFRSLG